MAPSSTKDLSLPNYFKQEGSDELRSLAVTEFSLGLTSLTQRQAYVCRATESFGSATILVRFTG